MAFTKKEHMEKISRIEDMEEEGLNIPRFVYLKKGSNVERLGHALIWAKELQLSNPEQIFNIRTYDYSEKSEQETTSCPHITDLTFEELINQLPKVNTAFFCMIDAEIPDNGRMAGTIFIPEERNANFTLEFVIKEKRAMVRDINSKKGMISLTGNMQIIAKYYDPENILEAAKRLSLPMESLHCQIISHIIKKALYFYKKGLIFEWTYFSIPSGRKYKGNSPESHIVWWEYRKP